MKQALIMKASKLLKLQQRLAEMNIAHVVVVKNTRNVVGNNMLKGIKTNDTKKITNNE